MYNMLIITLFLGAIEQLKDVYTLDLVPLKYTESRLGILPYVLMLFAINIFHIQRAQ